MIKKINDSVQASLFTLRNHVTYGSPILNRGIIKHWPNLCTLAFKTFLHNTACMWRPPGTPVHYTVTSVCNACHVGGTFCTGYQSSPEYTAERKVNHYRQQNIKCLRSCNDCGIFFLVCHIGSTFGIFTAITSCHRAQPN